MPAAAAPTIRPNILKNWSVSHIILSFPLDNLSAKGVFDYDGADVEWIESCLGDDENVIHYSVEDRDEIISAAAALGRKGGKAKSMCKTASSRENGKLGGRPRKATE
jgi:hypothetical protein